MEDRYGSDISEKMLMFVGTTPQITDGRLSEDEIRRRKFFKQNTTLDLQAIDPVSFGTEEAIIKDAKWRARYNKALLIREEAFQEYEEEKAKIAKWFRTKVEKNKEFITSAAARMELFANIQDNNPNDSEWDSSFDFSQEQSRNIIEIVDSEPGVCPLYVNLPTGGTIVRFGKFDRDYHYCCFRRISTLATLFATFKIQTPNAIATITGCKVKELPFFLQHYFKVDPYGGNPILNRLDPMDWVIENPWKKLGLGILVCMSKRTFHEIRKKLNLPRFSNWRKIGRKDYD